MKHAVVATLLLGACSGAFENVRPDGQPALFALLLNGGGTPRINYLSHVVHLSDMHQTLRERGVPAGRIAVLASDGDAPQADLAVGSPARGADAWLLEGTFFERPLLRPVRYLDTHIKEVKEVRSASPKSLASVFADARGVLRAGDTLFLFVTDHGERGKTPEGGRITLWDRGSISVKELRAEVAALPRGVRVVMAMSQCYSGAFAQVSLAPAPGHAVGESCGYFSTTARREAYGCYPESDGVNDDGYAVQLIAGLRRSGTLPLAHRDTLIADRTPDVPLRTSDLFLAGVVERAATRRHMSVDELVSSQAAEALASDLEEARLAQEVARSFAIPVPQAPAELESLLGRVETLRDRLRASANVWAGAYGELAQANLEDFLAAAPQWETTTNPRSLDRVPFTKLEPLQSSLVSDLTGFTARDPARRARLGSSHVRKAATRVAAYRSEVRAGAMLRVRTLLVAAVGRRLLEREGSAEERAQLAALRACEAAALPRTDPRGAAPAPVPFRSIELDERFADATTPTSLGLAVGEVAKSASGLPGGAATVTAVDAESPASAAGLRPGDVLLGAPGEPVRERGGMKFFLATLAGGSAELEVLRGGQRLTLQAPLRKAPRGGEAPDLSAAGRRALERLVSYRGSVPATLGAHQPYMLFFWATWCTFCKQAIPELLTLERQRGIKIIAITDEAPDVVGSFLSYWAAPFPQLVAVDPDRRVNEAFKVDGYPTFLLVDEKGRVTMATSGYRADRGLPLPFSLRGP